MMEPGTQIGHYKIISLLGKGGMGEVYEAFDTKLDRAVALKILPAALKDNPNRRARFEREAKSIASLQHPNVVTLHSIEEADGELFLVMELVKGHSLSDHIPSEGMPLDRLFMTAIPIVEAVAAAHQQGVTHRDLKPANILIDHELRPRVLDFGLAKATLIDETSETIGATEDLTEEGRILGTAAYMSPEQAEGKPIDHRSDIFSLGVVLYEMATGERPFKGDSGLSVLSAILKEEPSSVTEIRTGLPRHLGRIIRRCLHKDPSRRYQTALDLRNDLLELKEEFDSGTHEFAAMSAAPQPPKKMAAWLRVALFVAPLIAAVLAIYALSQKPDRTTHSGQTKISRLVTQGSPQVATISPDGRYVAYRAQSVNGQILRLLQVETGSDLVLYSLPAQNYSIYNIFFGPEGNYVYYVSGPSGGQFDVRRTAILGGRSELVLQKTHTAAISKDGQWIAAVRADEFNDPWNVLEVVSTKDQSVRSRIELEDREFWSVAWDGYQNQILVEIGQQRSEGLFSLGPDGGEPTKLELRQPVQEIQDICPDRAGKFIYLTGQTGESAARAILQVNRKTLEVANISQDFNNYSGCSISNDGRAIASLRHDLRSRLWIMDAKDFASARSIETTSGARDGGEGISWWDNQRIVYTAPVNGHTQLWELNLSDGSNRVLTEHGGTNPHSGGQRLIYTGGWLDNAYGVYGLENDTQQPVRISPEEYLIDGTATLSKDGTKAYLPLLLQRGLRTMEQPWEGGELKTTYDGGAHLVHYSPDGSRVNMHILLDGHYQTGIFTPDFGEPLKVLDTHSIYTSPWASNESFYEVRVDTSGLNIFEVFVETGESRRITDFRTGEIFSFAVSPDLQRLAVAFGEETNEVLLYELE